MRDFIDRRRCSRGRAHQISHNDVGTTYADENPARAAARERELVNKFNAQRAGARDRIQRTSRGRSRWYRPKSHRGLRRSRQRHGAGDLRTGRSSFDCEVAVTGDVRRGKHLGDSIADTLQRVFLRRRRSPRSSASRIGVLAGSRTARVGARDRADRDLPALGADGAAPVPHAAAVRRRREAEDDVHLPRGRAVRVQRHDQGDRDRAGALRRDRADARRVAHADHPQGARAARGAGHHHEPALPVRAGARLHHARRVASTPQTAGSAR